MVRASTPQSADIETGIFFFSSLLISLLLRLLFSGIQKEILFQECQGQRQRKDYKPRRLNTKGNRGSGSFSFAFFTICFFLQFSSPASNRANSSGMHGRASTKFKTLKKKNIPHHSPQRYISALSTERMWLISRANRATRETQGYRRYTHARNTD